MIIDGMRATDRTVALVLAFYAAFNKRDWAGVLATLSDDVRHDVNQGGRESGRSAFQAFLERHGRCYREEVRDLVVMTSPDGKQAAAEYTVHGEYLAAEDGLPTARNQKYQLGGGAFFQVADKRITRLTSYSNLQEWLRQISR
jgi:steroid delta-isomerase-like uncharacterized protein